MATTYKVVLIRHGESTWNKENRFTGWTDVDLSEKGVQEALSAAQVLTPLLHTFVSFWGTRVLDRSVGDGIHRARICRFL